MRGQLTNVEQTFLSSNFLGTLGISQPKSGDIPPENLFSWVSKDIPSFSASAKSLSLCSFLGGTQRDTKINGDQNASWSKLRKFAILKPIRFDTFLGAAKETPKRVPKQTGTKMPSSKILIHYWVLLSIAHYRKIFFGGFWGSQYEKIECDIPPWSLRTRGAIRPVQKGYLSDNCAIPHETKASCMFL